MSHKGIFRVLFSYLMNRIQKLVLWITITYLETNESSVHHRKFSLNFFSVVFDGMII